MIIISNNNLSASFHLACEEYLIDRFEEPVFMIWSSVPTILIGKNQNTYSEINMGYVQSYNIPVIRRMSGGGTVFCDLGNMNFSFIQPNQINFTNFHFFAQPIVDYLKSLGVPAEFSGRNDILVDGKKISGNAQYKKNGRVLHHGTLLFNSALPELVNALTPPSVKFQGKAVESVASRVTNISSHLKDENITVEVFKSGLYEYIAKSQVNTSFYVLNQEDQEAIEALSKCKYETWEWNFGKSPKFSYKLISKTLAGVVEILLEIDKGVIRNIGLYGDFFSEKEMRLLENRLIGCELNKTVLTDKLMSIKVEEYIGNLSNDSLIDLIIQCGK